MHIALLSYGTRGDVQPFVTLGDALARKGHTVRIIAPKNFGAWIERTGLASVSLSTDAEEFIHSPRAQRAIRSGDAGSFFRLVVRHDRDMQQAFIDELPGALHGVDAIIVHSLLVERAAAIAAKERVPMMPVCTLPMLPSRDYAFPFFPFRSFGFGPLNLASHKLALWYLHRQTRDLYETFRTAVGAPPLGKFFGIQLTERRIPAISAHSPTIFGVPRDWPEHWVTTGTLTPGPELRQKLGESEHPESLARWLAAGPPPVFFGFGSIAVIDDARLRSLVSALGVRVVVGAGWAKLPVGYHDEQLYVTGPCDHDWLFPQCAATIHHGGAGTTFAAARAGRPQIVCPIFGDQPMWASCIRTLGVGTSVRFQELDATRLAAALRRALAPDVVERARALGEKARAENAVELAVAAVERWMPETPIPE